MDAPIKYFTGIPLSCLSFQLVTFLIYLFVEKLTDARKIVGQKFNLCEEFSLMRLL
jgi:hypothetical protein